MKINPYIRFQNNCREAMAFYQQCLGGDLTLQAVRDSPIKDLFPPHLQESILHADLTIGDVTILVSEVSEDDGPGSAITLSLTCGSKEEAISTFDKLAEGGRVIHPVKTFFAGRWVAWLINSD
jgi:PhnB protein